MMKKKGGAIGKITWLLVVIGALNWGLVGIFSWNLVEWIFGTGALTNIIYILVGVAGLMMILHATMCKGCRGCGNGKCEDTSEDTKSDDMNFSSRPSDMRSDSGMGVDNGSSIRSDSDSEERSMM